MRYQEIIGLYNLLVAIQLRQIEMLGLSDEFNTTTQALHGLNNQPPNIPPQPTPERRAGHQAGKDNN